MKKLLSTSVLIIAAAASTAQGAELRTYRWRPREWKPLPYLFSASIGSALGRESDDAPPATVGLGGLVSGQELLKSKGEMIETGVQMFGPAVIEGSWTQTIFKPDGHVVYAAGAVLDNLPGNPLLERVKAMRFNTHLAMRAAQASKEYSRSKTRRPPELRIRLNAKGEWEPYRRFEFLNLEEDKLLFLDLAEDNSILAQGDLHASAVDGMGLVFPRGPKLSPLTEVPLPGLLGDGSLNGKKIRVESALGLSVVIPSLRFFFGADDKRLDLAQVYFSAAEAFSWMKEKLGIELRQPLNFRLHIGNGGVSNAAFYDHNVVYLGTGDGIRYKDLTRDPSVIIHECIHAYIDTFVGLPPDGEGGSFNEGFADLFAALILKNPRMGESSFQDGPFRRTLENNLKAFVDFRAGVYQNGSIIAGTFWDMRRVLSDEKVATLAFRTLTRLGKGAQFSDFLPALTSAASSVLDSEEQASIMTIVQERGWVQTL